MGGSNRQNKKSSSLSFSSAFNIFKSRRPPRVDDNYVNVSNPTRVFHSDDDGRGPCGVADPQINTKTSAFIAHFYATRFSESERQIYQPAAAIQA